MPKIAQVLHHVPRAHQAVLFLLHVVTLLTGWPAEEASKGNLDILWTTYSTLRSLSRLTRRTAPVKTSGYFFVALMPQFICLRLEVPAGQKNTINPHCVFKRILIVDHVGGCKTSRFK